MLLSRELGRLIEDCEALDIHPTANHLLRLALWQEAEADTRVRDRLEEAVVENKLVQTAVWRGQTVQVQRLRDYAKAKRLAACQEKRQQEQDAIMKAELLRKFAAFQQEQQEATR